MNLACAALLLRPGSYALEPMVQVSQPMPASTVLRCMPKQTAWGRGSLTLTGRAGDFVSRELHVVRQVLHTSMQ